MPFAMTGHGDVESYYPSYLDMPNLIKWSPANAIVLSSYPCARYWPSIDLVGAHFYKFWHVTSNALPAARFSCRSK
jgi:hypothetical protein